MHCRFVDEKLELTSEGTKHENNVKIHERTVKFN